MSHDILAIHVPNRAEKAAEVQKVLGEHAAAIKTRLGLHDAEHDSGVIILELLPARADEAFIADFKKKLEAVGAEVQHVSFKH